MPSSDAFQRPKGTRKKKKTSIDSQTGYRESKDQRYFKNDS